MVATNCVSGLSSANQSLWSERSLLTRLSGVSWCGPPHPNMAQKQQHCGTQKLMLRLLNVESRNQLVIIWWYYLNCMSVTVKLHSSSSGPKDLLSDRCILSCPSMDLVICLLDFRLNFASNRSIVPRLAASLAACAQLSALGTELCSCFTRLFLNKVRNKFSQN